VNATIASIQIDTEQNAPSATDGFEPLYTLREVASLLRWHPDTVRRYFKNVPGVLVKYQAKRYKRPYRQYMIPKSVFQREWNRMAGFNSDSRRAA
jgi:hypothetical protein